MTSNGFSVTRVFEAPVEKVWRTWTEPQHFAAWFGAKAETLTMEVRPGGVWHADIATPDGEFPIGGVYHEVIEHERLVWTVDVPGGPVVMTATFADAGGRTQATYHQDVPPGSRSGDQAERDGAASTLDSFAAYLATV